MNDIDRLRAVVGNDIAILKMLDHRTPSEWDHQKADDRLLMVICRMAHVLGMDDEAAQIASEYESIPKRYA